MKKFAALSFCSILLFTACSAEPKEQERYSEPPKLSCAEGQSEYVVSGTPMQFCYDPAWGQVVTQDISGTRGEAKRVSFSAEGASPTIQYQTYDFDGEGSEFCFDCYDINGPEAAIKEEVIEKMAAGDDLSVRKSEVFGIRAIRVNDQAKLGYYVPGAFDGKNLTISAPSEFAEGLDDFIWDFIIYEQ